MPIDTLRLDSDRRLVSIVMGVMLIPIVWFFGPDWVAYGHGQPLQVRLWAGLVCAAIPIVGLILIRRADNDQRYARTVLGISLAMAAIILTIYMDRPFGASLRLRTPLLFLVALYGALPNTFFRQISPALMFTAGVILQRYFWLTDDSGGDRATDILILLVVNLAGVAMVYRRRRTERKVSELVGREYFARIDAERALKELKTLRGIIRICSYCQKVHNEAGVWQQIEAYVRDHSHAEFSHGICPDCVAEQFPPETVPG